MRRHLTVLARNAFISKAPVSSIRQTETRVTTAASLTATNSHHAAQPHRRTMSSQKPPINLIRGWPAPSLLPSDILSAASQRILADPDIFVPALQYGPDSGYQPLREALATLLSENYNVSRDPERICISGGASQNVACIMQSFTDPVVTKAVWLVAPCYHLISANLEDAGFAGRLRAFPEDDEGANLEVLEERIKALEDEIKDEPERAPFKSAGEDRKHYRHIIYVVPTCANPSGKTMSLRRREGLVKLARKYDALVICDDVYDFLQWPLDGDASTLDHPGLKLPRLCDIDLALGPTENDPRGFGHAVSNGSFSKLVGPGVRTGWLEGSRAFAFGLAQTGATKSGGAPSQFCASMMAQLIERGELQKSVANKIRPALQRRHRILMDAIHEHLVPLGVQARESSLAGGKFYGGYFVWMTLEDGVSSRLVAEVAVAEENLIVGSGSMFEVRGDEKSFSFDNALRLTFSYVPEDDLTEGVRRLGNAIRKVKENPAKYEEWAAKESGQSILRSSV